MTPYEQGYQAGLEKVGVSAAWAQKAVGKAVSKLPKGLSEIDKLHTLQRAYPKVNKFLNSGKSHSRGAMEQLKLNLGSGKPKKEVDLIQQVINREGITPQQYGRSGPWPQWPFNQGVRSG